MGSTRHSSRLAGIENLPQPTKNLSLDSNPSNDAFEDMSDDYRNDTSAAFTNGNTPKRRARSGTSTPSYTKKEVCLHSMITTNTDRPKSQDTAPTICVISRYAITMGAVIEYTHVIPKATSAKTASHYLSM